jgi:hypothetical protein
MRGSGYFLHGGTICELVDEGSLSSLCSSPLEVQLMSLNFKRAGSRHTGENTRFL